MVRDEKTGITYPTHAQMHQAWWGGYVYLNGPFEMWSREPMTFEEVEATECEAAAMDDYYDNEFDGY